MARATGLKRTQVERPRKRPAGGIEECDKPPAGRGNLLDVDEHRRGPRNAKAAQNGLANNESAK
eukprot:1321698-Alexandrium_andersonii.AAC.1